MHLPILGNLPILGDFPLYTYKPKYANLECKIIKSELSLNVRNSIKLHFQ